MYNIAIYRKTHLLKKDRPQRIGMAGIREVGGGGRQGGRQGGREVGR